MGWTDRSPFTALLCDADGCLFPSEEPAFAASAEVTNRFLASIGARARFSGDELRRATTGKNFRTTARELAAAEGIRADKRELERWVAAEREAVVARLAVALRPDPTVRTPLTSLAASYRLAVVSSSAESRVGACLEVTGLADLFSPESRFSAEDSLPHPASKPNPAIYLHAGDALGTPPGAALAVEDSVPGARAAVAAGYETIGLVQFVPEDERQERESGLLEAGVVVVLSSWLELERRLSTPKSPGAPAGSGAFA